MKIKKPALVMIVTSFAVACSEPTVPSQLLLPTASTLALNPVPGYPFPNSPDDGLVTLCKISNVAGTFGFDVTIGGVLTEISITVNAGQENTRVCHASPLINSSLGASQIETVVIVEDDPGAGVTTVVDIDQYFVQGVPYHGNALADEFDVAPRTATVFINDDLEKRVTFTNTTTQDGGCTLTQGYWKNHLGSWPAGAGFAPGDAFFTTGKTYLEVITIEEDGNAFYILGRQYIAALLNIANGADPTAIQADLDAATDLLDDWGSAVGPTKQQGRATWITLAGILDQFNRGLIGPGKCTG